MSARPCRLHDGGRWQSRHEIPSKRHAQKINFHFYSILQKHTTMTSGNYVTLPPPQVHQRQAIRTPECCARQLLPHATRRMPAPAVPQGAKPPCAAGSHPCLWKQPAMSVAIQRPVRRILSFIHCNRVPPLRPHGGLVHTKTDVLTTFPATAYRRHSRLTIHSTHWNRNEIIRGTLFAFLLSSEADTQPATSATDMTIRR